MSRQEDFIDAGIAYRMKHSKPMCIAGSDLADVERDFNRVFPFEAGAEYGYQYAKTHPNWISVEDELPEHNEEDNGLISYPTVLVCLYDGFRTEDYYDDISGEWRDFDGDVEYWMPMPQPPRKEDKI